MRQSQLFGSTRRETPKDEESKNAILLMRGGYINKTLAGVYSYLPLGLRVLKNVMKVVREEMDAVPGVQEVLMSAIQPKEIWEESGRWEAYKDDMYRLEEGATGLGPTHEEMVTDLFRRYVGSYKDLPVAVYQIQTKFRKEARAKSGLLRGRELMMKDLYSFHLTEEDLETFYASMIPAYVKAYERCGLKAVLTEASGGQFTDKVSHEFQLVNPAGEDTIYLNEDGTARNKEVVSAEEQASLEGVSAIEIGNIFRLYRRYSTPMKAAVLDENGESTEVWMGCYGLGISRVMGSIVEHHGDLEKGKIVWPREIAPFEYHLIDLTPDKAGEKLYLDMKAQGKNVLYDDRKASAGEKFADADLVGAPTRLIVSKRSIEAGGVEKIDLASGESAVVALDQVA